MRFTDSEDQVLLKHVAVNSGNLDKAFKDAAIETGRSKASMKARWYLLVREWEAAEARRKSRQGTTARDLALKPYFDKIRAKSKYVPNRKNIWNIDPAKAIANTASQLAKRQAQARQTTRCLSETARLKARLQSLSKLLQ